MTSVVLSKTQCTHKDSGACTNVITDANECKIAAFAILGIATVDLTIATAGVTTDSTNGMPYGCYYETVSTNIVGKVFLGTATGTDCGQDQRCICG